MFAGGRQIQAILIGEIDLASIFEIQLVSRKRV